MTESSSPAVVGSESPLAMGRLVARERVRAMEALAGIIAHEIRSSVLGVTSAAQLLRYSLPPDPVAEKSLGRILQESERLSSLHEALSEYATEVPPRFVSADPDRLWREVVTNMRGALEANSVVLTHTPASSGASCLLDEQQLTRAFERLVHHAIARGQSGCELRIASAVDDHEWHSTISVARMGHPGTKSGNEYERPTFFFALANRTFVAHGGEAVDHAADPASQLITVRLPLSREAE
jgi:signal transduction histidine kinase